MAIQIKDILDNVKEIFLTDSALNTLMDFERVLDEVDIYSFANWKKGELVEGPIYEKYFVRCKFMWPEKLMPDPRGAERLLNYDCNITYEKSILKKEKKIEDPDDFRPGTKFAKMIEIPIWIVEITMPKKLMQEISVGSLEIEGKKVDLTDVDEAFDEGDDDELEQTDDQKEQFQQPAPAAPAPVV